MEEETLTSAEQLGKVMEGEADFIPSDKHIIEHMDLPFEPIDGRVLVKPMPPVMITKSVVEIDEEETKKLRDEARQKAKEDNSEMEWPEAVTKVVTKEVESMLRIGVVLAIGKEDGRAGDYKGPIEVGDKIVYYINEAMPFELFKDSVLLQRYSIKGKWLKDIE